MSATNSIEVYHEFCILKLALYEWWNGMNKSNMESSENVGEFMSRSVYSFCT